MRLQREQLSQVLDVVRTVGLARNRDEFFRSTLKGVVSLLPCLVATINEVDPLAGRVAYWVEPSSFHIADGAPELLAELAAEHPLIASFAKSGDGSAWRISDFWSQEEFHATRLYQELYQPMGVEYQMAVGLTTPLPTVLGLVVNRSDSDFSDGERAVLNAARPHLAQAWRNARDQERLRSLVDAANDAASESGWGVIVLWDPPEELTPGTLARLYRFFGQPTRTSPLPARVERWVASQIAQTSNPAELELARPLSARLDDRRLVLKYLPAQRAHPGAIVVSDERRTAQRRSYESLGLSTREAEIVRLVTAGESNSSIAGRLFVSPGTVKKHLDNVYNKLGVRGRGPLTAFLLDITSR